MRHSIPPRTGDAPDVDGDQQGATRSDSHGQGNDWPCFSAGLQYLAPCGGTAPGDHVPTYLNNGYGFVVRRPVPGGRLRPWHVIKDPNGKNFRVDELEFRPALSGGRLTDRQQLLQSIDSQRRHWPKVSRSGPVRRMQQATTSCRWWPERFV
ncbi:MAG: hypothetical protein Ct9H300mP1_38480 [Planctomycetaceae bacterium]|nr:MAG: hypothetical protein Ct9H300mP1_38480 [Planctomycetaceae bacterium]